MAIPTVLKPALQQPTAPIEGSPHPLPMPSAEESAVILVVDDDQSNRESLSRRLQRRGHRTLAAAGGLEALALLAKNECDLVLLDVMMPGMSGLEVLKYIRQAHSPSDLPVIMASAKDESGDIVSALELGANDYVTKPLDFAVVVARVRTQLHLRRAVRQIVALEQDLSRRNAELESANAELRDAAVRAKRELDTAARVQSAMMPSSPPIVAGVRFAWAFEPCDQLAGDCFDAFALGEGRAAFYVLDVSGHGVAASLLAVAASRLLSITGEPDSISLAANPAQVADRLNRRLPWDPLVGQFLTLFYATLDIPRRQFTYTSAGHPWAIHLRADGSAHWLDQSNLPIGIGDVYEQHTIDLAPGERVYLYSDGLTEAMDERRELFGMERLRAAVEQHRHLHLKASLSQILSEVTRWRNGAPSADDVTLVAMELS